MIDTFDRSQQVAAVQTHSPKFLDSLLRDSSVQKKDAL
jgi:hypothetical protein